MGPRTIPNLNSPLAGKELIPSDSVFNANVNTGDIKISINGKSYPLGSQVLYVVK